MSKDQAPIKDELAQSKKSKIKLLEMKNVASKMEAKLTK